MKEFISYTDFRSNLKTKDKVCDNHLPLLVTRKNGEDVKVISKDDFASLEEIAYLSSSNKNANNLISSLTGKNIISFQST